MRVFDNIAFALRLQKLLKEEIRETVHQVAEMVKIGELLDRYPRQLSGGQRQRVALARALAVKPKLFLLDEPLSNLDAKLRVAMRTELKAIHQRSKATSIFVTHDQSEAMSMADSIVVMRDGIVIQAGTPDDVYSRSADTFVAGFIGTPPTNFFDVAVQRDDGNILLRHQDFQLTLEADARKDLVDYTKKDLILGVRPEDIQIVKAEDSITTQKVLVVEPQGSHQIIAIEVQDNIVKIRASADLSVHPGDTLHLAFKQSKLHFFDSVRETRVGTGAAAAR
jgi:multiple sugar transport system ATP-binding protein